MPHLSRHPTTADAVPLPSKEGRFTVYKRRRFPICAPPPSPRAKPVPPAPHRRRRYPSPAGRSPLISHFTAYSCQLSAYRESAAPQHPSSCSEAAIPPYASGAQHPQPGRASEAMPDLPPLCPIHRISRSPQNIKKAALPNLCAATTIPHS